MSSSQILKSVWALITSMSLMMIGYGMFSTFISLRVELEGFSRQIIGYQTSAFYLGVVIGSLICAKLINRVGNIRAFSVFCALSAVSLLLFPFFKYISVWIILRGVLGFCMAGQYMCIESWINSRTSVNTRGTVFAVYMMAVNFSFAIGQLMLNISDPISSDFFMIGAVLYALALIPVSITTSPQPEPVHAEYFGIVRLFKISPVAISGCFANGLVLGAILGLSPIFIKDVGYDIQTITLFMALYMMSGLFAQFPIGKLSDLMDRRYVIVGACIVLFLSSIPLIFILSPSIVTLYALAILLGSTSQTIYPLCITYANDYLRPEEMVKASGGLVLAYGLGAATGPTLAALSMGKIGPNGLFIFISIVVLIYILFVFYRSTVRHVPDEDDKSTFIPLPDAVATPGGLEIAPYYTTESPVKE